MFTVARAFLWEFRRRHQLGLILLAIYLVAFLVVQATILGPEYRVRLDPPNGFAFFVILPGVSMWFYMAGAFTYGLSGDLAARESIFPKRLLTLPVTTTALAGWPMLFGVAAAAALWIMMALFMRIAGAEYRLPLVWPAVLSGLYIAWMQALTWMPYGITGIRVVIAVVWLFIVDAIVIAAFEKQVSQAAMLALLLPQLPIAYGMAWLAVSRARRGVVPDWTALWSAPIDVGGRGVRRGRTFQSAATAQLWFEWRRSGRALPAMVALVVPAELLVLFLPGQEDRTIGNILVLLLVSITPPVLAFFSATMMGTPSPFTATRPVSDAALIGAKLKALLLSTAAAWAIVLVSTPLALIGSGASVSVVDALRPIADWIGNGRALALVVFAIAVLMLSTWRQLVQSLCVSLSGNQWLIKSTVVIGLIALAIFGPVIQWVSRHDAARAVMWNALPVIAMALVATKCAAGALVVVKLHARRVLSERAVIAGAAAWLLGVVAAYGFLGWFLTDVVTPAYLKAAMAIALIPLARVSAAPLAQARSRHRGIRSRPTAAGGALPLVITLACIGVPPAFVLVRGTSHYVNSRTTGRIAVGAVEREYVLHVPAGYDGSRPVPLVVSIHGAGTWPSLHEHLSGWSALADQHGFIVAYPGGDGTAFKVFDQRDVPLIAALIDRIESSYNVDADRVYVNGLSNGGGMSYALSCALSDRIAAVGAVAPAITMSANLCPGATAIPLILFHGTADRFTPYEGGKVFIAPNPFPDIRRWTANWAHRNRCAPSTRESIVAADVTRIEYDGCAADVVFYRISGGGHSWPGGQELPGWFVGPTSHSINATELMWSFFKDHPRRTP